MKSNKRVTIQDIANEVNVSYATVSKVLSGKVGGNIRVSENTKNKILETSVKMGYVPNHMARNLKSSNLSLISVFTYENMDDIEKQKEFLDFYFGVYLEGEKLGLDVLFLNTRKNISSSSRVTLSSGAIMIGIERDNSDIKALAKKNFPLVFVGRRKIEGLETCWVSFNYKKIISEIFESICKKNIDRILYIKSADKTEPYDDKRACVEFYAKKYSISIDTIILGKDSKLSDGQMIQLMDNPFYLVDRIWQTKIVEKFLEDQSLELGVDKLGVVMEDDWLNLNNWTCWDNQRKQLGALATDHLFCMLNKKEHPKQKLISLKLIYKKSFNVNEYKHE